jgi:hypothetical protein
LKTFFWATHTKKILQQKNICSNRKFETFHYIKLANIPTYIGTYVNCSQICRYI